ncbi:MAG: hypothetical protein ABJ006_00015, partial [Balneola sp.]
FCRSTSYTRNIGELVAWGGTSISGRRVPPTSLSFLYQSTCSALATHKNIYIGRSEALLSGCQKHLRPLTLPYLGHHFSSSAYLFIIEEPQTILKEAHPLQILVVVRASVGTYENTHVSIVKNIYIFRVWTFCVSITSSCCIILTWKFFYNFPTVLELRKGFDRIKCPVEHMWKIERRKTGVEERC